MKHVVLYVGHLYKLFWTKKIDRVGRGGQRRSKYGPEWASLLYVFGLGAFWRPLDVSRTPEIPPKWSLQLPLIDLSPFPGSLTHLGASRRLRGQKYIKARPILGHILTFFDPPCQPGQFFLVQISLCRCPTYRTTCFMLNSHLLGVF